MSEHATTLVNCTCLQMHNMGPFSCKNSTPINFKTCTHKSKLVVAKRFATVHLVSLDIWWFNLYNICMYMCACIVHNMFINKVYISGFPKMTRKIWSKWLMILAMPMKMTNSILKYQSMQHYVYIDTYIFYWFLNSKVRISQITLENHPSLLIFNGYQ